MKYLLFLYLTNFGWIQFSVEDSKEFCEKVKTHITESHAEYTEGRCVKEDV